MPKRNSRISTSLSIRRLLSATSVAMLLFIAPACSHAGHDDHDSHNHETESGHDHETEGHDHEAEGHDHEAEGHDHDHDEAKGAEGAGAHGEISLPAAKAKASGVEVTEMRPAEFREVIHTGGRVLPAAGSEATAVATRAGIVRLSRPWSVGMSVAAGTPLFSISGSRLPEGDVSARAKIEFDRASKEFERVKKLYADKLATQQEYQQAEAALSTASVAYDAVGGSAGGGSVVAPKGGYVLSCLVKDGDYVDVGAPMMTITTNRRLQLQADLPRRDYDRAASVTSANFRTGDSDGTTFSLADLNGRLVSHATATADGAAYIPLIFEFDNARGVVAGSYAEVWLLAAPKAGVLSVPEEALSEEQGVYSVFVRLDPDCYERRVVTTGARDGRNVEITSGLHAGEQVVTKGAVHVRLAAAAKSIPGHTHNH